MLLLILLLYGACKHLERSHVGLQLTYVHTLIGVRICYNLTYVRTQVGPTAACTSNDSRRKTDITTGNGHYFNLLHISFGKCVSKGVHM
jgi:hypothetical protein